MSVFSRVLGWSMSIVGGGLALWYLKDPTRRRDLLEFPPFPNDRVRDLLGCEMAERPQAVFGKKWPFSVIYQFCERSADRPRFYMEPGIDPDLLVINPLEALAQLELLEEEFPFEDEPEELDDEVEDFEPNAPLEHELDDEPPGAGAEYLPRGIGPYELGNVAGPAGDAAANVENAAARRVAEAVVRDVLETAQQNLANTRASGADENGGTGDAAGSSGNEEQRPVARPNRRINLLSPGSTPKKQRAAMPEESEDEPSSSSG